MMVWSLRLDKRLAHACAYSTLFQRKSAILKYFVTDDDDVRIYMRVYQVPRMILPGIRDNNTYIPGTTIITSTAVQQPTQQ